MRARLPDLSRTFRRQRSRGDDLGQVATLEIFHRDVEILAVRAVFVDCRDIAADAAELLLELRAPALRIENLLRLAVGAGGHELQRYPLRVPTVGRQEHRGHASAADFPRDFVGSDAQKHGVHRLPRRPRGAPDAVDRRSGGSTKKLSRRSAARTVSAKCAKASSPTP
jgi:hypothetical protein